MLRPILASLAAGALTLTFVTPAVASNPTYRAVPVAKIATADAMVIADTLWACSDAGCVTGKATARPAIVCEQAAKKVGKLESFSVGATAFDEAALAKCNAKAKA